MTKITLVQVGGETPGVPKKQVTIMHWQVLQTPSGECHLVGADDFWQEGRVSTAVRHVDRASLCALTISGHPYQLKGPPGQGGLFVWLLLMHKLGIDPDACKDLTDDPAAWPLDLTAVLDGPLP